MQLTSGFSQAPALTIVTLLGCCVEGWRLKRRPLQLAIARALFLLQRRVDRRIGADLVIRSVGPPRH